MAPTKKKPKKKVKKKESTSKKKEPKKQKEKGLSVTLSLSPEKKSDTGSKWLEKEEEPFITETSQQSWFDPEALILQSEELPLEEQPTFETLEQQLMDAPSDIQEENAAYSAATESSYSSQGAQGYESGDGSYSSGPAMTTPAQLTDNVVRGGQVTNPFGRQNLRQAEQITRVPQTADQTDTFVESQRKYEDSKHLTEETSRNSRVRSRRISRHF